MKFINRYARKAVILKEEIDKVVLKSNYPCDYEESKNLPLYLYPSKKSKKILLFVHGLGTNNIKYLKWFPKAFAENNYNSALMILPYHFERTPKGKKSGEMFLDTTDDVTLRGRFEHASVDLLTSVEYLKNKYPDSDLYLMGFSFGGMISVISSAFSKDIKALSLCVTGGNFYHITWRSFVTKVLRVQYEQNNQCSAEKCKIRHGEVFKNYMNNLKDPSIELNSAPSLCYEYDPLTFAKFIDQPTIMFRALFDIFIPKQSSLDLYNNIYSRKKEIHPLFTGHLSSYLMKKHILKKTLRFFESVDD
jgi:esterase/lipase